MKINKNYKIIIILLGLLIIITPGLILKLYNSSRPNIILIMVDTLRPDHLGCYGYRRDTSPNIDTLARNSTLYVNTFSQAAWTIPSVYSLLTSLYPSQHKMDSWGSRINHNIPTLISVLQDNGYSVGVFGNQGFFFRNLKENCGSLLKELKQNSDAYTVTKDALEWAKSQEGRFFLWIYYVNPHRPYNPSPPHDKLYSFRSDRHLPIRNADPHYIGGGIISPVLSLTMILITLTIILPSMMEKFTISMKKSENY